MVGQISIQDAQNANVVSFIEPSDTRLRLEIDEFAGDNDMTNLFLLALIEMFREDPSRQGDNEDWWTFYSLSAVHGLPAEFWNGVQQKASETPASGYCTHGMLLFPTWHRVYMAMFEQAVANKIQAIAKRWTNEPEKTIYQKAADRFRLPYWDPVLPRNEVPRSDQVDEKIWGLPKILGTSHVWVKRPETNEPEQVPNPLYSFSFPTQELENKGRKLINWNARAIRRPGYELPPRGNQQTLRSPDETGESHMYQASAGKDRVSLELKIQRQATAISTKLWKLLSRYRDGDNNELRPWQSFATHWVYGRDGKPELSSDGQKQYQSDTSVSLESWHDNIHMLVGSGVQPYYGHMANPAIASFDPIFWLHHCNIDRILAIYQALFPDKWFPEVEAQQASALLYPFRKGEDADSFWTSNDIRDWKNLGFAVPGNKDLDAQGIQALEKHLFDYYNWHVQTPTRTTEGTYPPPSVSDHWPKKFNSSFALNGPSASPVPQPGAHPGTQQVFARRLRVQEPLRHFEEQPKQAEASVTPIDLPKAYPPGTINKDAQKQLTWNARVRVKKFAFDGSFNVNLFIGDINENQTERFLTKKNEVGFTGVFASSTDAPCANCAKQRDEGIIYEDAIPITHSLYAYLRTNDAPDRDGPKAELRTLESFQPEHVVPFLKKYLDWRVTNIGSQLITDRQEIIDSKLEITVSAREFELPSVEHPLGVYYPPTAYPEATSDKLGGNGYRE